MTLALDVLPVSESALSRFDPRWKLAALLTAAIAVACLRTLPALLAAFVGALLLTLLARLPRRWLLGRLGAVAPLLILCAVLLPLLNVDDGPKWAIGPMSISAAGLTAATRLCLKALTILLLMLVLWATAPSDQTLKAAHALRVPGFFIQLTLLTYRHLFLVADELGRMRTALRVRGYRNRANLHSYRTVGQVTGVLLVRSFERAERVGQAMRCRGFDGRFRSLATFHTRAADVAGFTVIVAAAAGLLTCDLLRR